MKFKQKLFDGSSSLQGETAPFTFFEIAAVFGLPNNDGDDYKVTSEWKLEFEDGTIATIYDYKATEAYDGSYPSVENFRHTKYEWHIGGRSKRAAELVNEVLSKQPVSA